MTLKSNVCRYPKRHPAVPKRELLSHEASPSILRSTLMLCSCSRALPASHYPRLRCDMRHPCLRYDPGGSSPVRRAVLTPPWGQPPSPSSSHPLPGAGSGAPLTPCWNSSACRNQQETNHFPDPDLAACPGAGVPEPAQHRSQDHVAGKGEGGWDQPRAGLHQRRLPGNLIPIRCCWALVQKSGQTVSAYLTSTATKCSWVPALKTLHVNTLC